MTLCVGANDLSRTLESKTKKPRRSSTGFFALIKVAADFYSFVCSPQAGRLKMRMTAGLKASIGRVS